MNSQTCYDIYMNNISDQGHDHNTELTFFDVVVGVRNPHTSYIKTTVACGPHAKIGCALDRYAKVEIF